ncbi:translational activator of GCN4, variant 2 [Clonorchis sinensis]|uniref:Translational activator of GCN4, variant 2 n=2 Tax=Clonorchis sinensis TaxID=79923 RepID=A0A8T1M8I8_CLOSI|nr:translational activator of GCN4, variant 2 [Clonorchis sinensis]
MGLVDYFMNIGCLDHTHTRALQRLVNWSPSGFGRALFDVLFKRLSDSSLISASVHEVNIMMTPETQLYNQELLESLPKYKKTMSNIKRESKLYSYDEQLDMMAAKRQREEMLKKTSVTSDPPLIEALADQLTEKQLEAVRVELAKEAEIRQHMLQLDIQARHLTNLLTQCLQACLSKSARRTSQSTLATGNLAVYMCPKLSGLLHRLLTSPLVAPYILQAYLRSVSLTMRCEPKLDGQCELIAPVIGWWSIRVLGPARLLLPADLDILSPTLDGMCMRLRNAHKNVLMSAMQDATNLLTHWSEEPIAAQTTRILNFLRSKFPQRSINATVLWSFLCPNQEFLLLASGWARPLFEELVDLSFPALLCEEAGQSSCVDSHAIIPLSVRNQWNWITSEHVCNMLAIWQQQLHDPTDDNSTSEFLSWDRVTHVLPFSKLFRLLRQVVEGSITDLDAYAVSADQHLLSNKDEESESTNIMTDTSDEDHLNHSKALAQVAMDIMRSATNLLTQELSVSDTLDSAFRQLVNSVLNSLLTGTVAETPQAREICLSCILILTEKIPSFVEKANLDDKTVWTEGCGAISTPSLSTTDKEVDHDHECEDLDEVEPQGNDPMKPRKKLNKNQRRKQKQAQMVADLAKAQGGAQVEQPYESPALWPVLPLWQKLQVRVWVARSDASTEVASLGERLWVSLGLNQSCEQPCTPEEQQSHAMLPLLDTPKNPLLLKPMLLAQRLLLETTRPIAPVQKATADAFALCLMRRTPDEIAVSLEQMIRLYKVMLFREPAVKDNIGRILIPESADRWRERVGLAFALTRLPEALNPSDVAHRSLRPGLLVGEPDQVDGDHVTVSVEKPSGEVEKASRTDTWLINMFRFLVPDGLNDRHPAVQSVMLKAGLRAVAVYGKAHLDRLLPILETFLNKAPNVAELDAVRQSVLILTGSLSQHLSADDPRVWNIFNRLLGTLSFPSDVVQQAVEDCLASLVTKLSEEQKTKTVTRLMSTLLGASSYAERHGAAHGIAGVARGLGILSLKHYGIIDKLIPALEDTKSAKHREGALLAVERLCLGMGRLFEPYIFRLISGLLTAFGDSSPSVREAASGTARAIMSKLSAHGVRLILPALLRAIDEQQSWRTKAQSVELLATMTHCAPKQLSACLPQIVPRLLDVLVDSQDQLKQAGVRALKQIGNVIRNPEVQALVPLLTGCLQDPLADKMPCLLALRDTCFVHVLDAPSLALILPVIQRAFADRSTESRKSAAQIFGNLHSLARKEELQPYVPNIVPSLKACLLDAVPEIRSVAAAALGALVRGMGESCFTEILPWLLSTLTSEASSVDRSGAAQGLAEVLGAMGIERLRSILPDFIRTAASDSKVAPHVRDGYLMLFVYLPTVFRDSFAEFIGPIIPTILNSLSDETEFLRETALRAAQRIVQMFAETSVELLLPELERGIADPNWRIRHASVKLLGDLLYQLSGLSGKGTTKTEDEDDTFGTSAAHERLSAIMGSERHDRVLARLHMVRSDPSLFVRQVAVHVWKVVVPNTSRTLREIMPVLIRLILDTLGTSNREQQQLAARALGDVVRKLGERILPEIIPLLVAGLNSSEPNHRRGVCTGLMELMRNCPREQLFNYTDSLLIPIRRTLCDELPEVRRSGARTFEILYGALGVRCLDGVLPDILAQLDDPKTSPHALDGLRQLLVVKGKAVMPYLVPKLIYPTVNAKAFAYLATVAGDALSRQLNRILPALLTTVAQVDCNPDHEEDLMHCAEVLICIYDLAGVRYIFNTLLGGLVVGSSSTSTTTGGSAPTATPNQVSPGTPAYRTACLRLLNAYLNVSFEEAEAEAITMVTSLGQTIGSTQAVAGHSDDTDEEDESDEEDEDFDEDEDGEDEDEEEDSDDMDTDSNLDEGADEDIPDSKESVSKVLREFYPLALRNICRLLALHDTPTLSRSWDCLEALFKRWTPETVTSQISDLRQGIRGAVSELHRTAKGKSGEDAFLPGFSDPNLPLASLVKLYADCTLRGQPDVKEPAAQALSECITHASGSALQRCVVKVLGPLIRLLGERQTNVVRMAVVESLTSLITKCSQSARPFVTQLQATFLKCLGDSHRPMRLLGCHGLASVAAITPKLDPLLMDLARVPVHTVLSNWPGERIPGITKPDSTLPSVGAAATALTLTGIATYPETSLHALRLCLLGSRGRATMDALNSVVCSLAPLMFLQDTGSKQQPVEDVAFGDTEEDEDDDINLRGVGGQSKKINPIILADAIRVVASVCIGCTIAAAHATLSNAPTAEDVLQPVRLLEQYLFPKTTIKAHEHWTFQQSQALILLTALKHAPGAVINAQTLLTPVVSRLERLLSNLCSADKTIVCQLGLRAVGCFVGHVVETPDVKYDLNGLLQLLNKGFMHDLVDTRSLTTTVTSHIAWRSHLSDNDPVPSWLAPFLAVLMNAMRDKASGVRVGGETALVVLCRIGAPKESQLSASLVRLCIDGIDPANRSFLDTTIQRLRKQNWSEVWSQGCPDMEIILT